VPIFLKSGSLNLLEPSGPVKACNGIALPYLDMGKCPLFVLFPFSANLIVMTEERRGKYRVFI
jgi:hypothetical protein